MLHYSITGTVTTGRLELTQRKKTKMLARRATELTVVMESVTDGMAAVNGRWDGPDFQVGDGRLSRFGIGVQPPLDGAEHGVAVAFICTSSVSGMGGRASRVGFTITTCHLGPTLLTYST